MSRVGVNVRALCDVLYETHDDYDLAYDAIFHDDHCVLHDGLHVYCDGRYVQAYYEVPLRDDQRGGYDDGVYLIILHVEHGLCPEELLRRVLYENYEVQLCDEEYSVYEALDRHS